MPKGKINRSQAIREILEKSPQVPPKELVEQLALKGIQVKPGLVYMIKGRLAQMKSHKGRKAARVARAGEKTGINDPVALIVKVKALAREAGGIDNLKVLVTALAD
jgi:hypothetical protein